MLKKSKLPMWPAKSSSDEYYGFGDHYSLPHGGACGVKVIIVGNGHSDSSSNPGREWLHFT